MNYLVFISTGNNRKSKINQIIFIHLPKKKKVDLGGPRLIRHPTGPGIQVLSLLLLLSPWFHSLDHLSKMVALAPAIIPTFQLAEWRK